MKAMVIRAFGGPEVFEQRDIPVPSPRAHEVLVQVHANSVNPVDFKVRQAGTWAGIHPPAVIGYDVSGVVEAVGADVRDFKPGDEVFYTPEIFGAQGANAEYHVAAEAIVARKPQRLSHEEAASLPLAGGTAWDALVTRAGLRVGESVLIHGGTGGVGSLAVQIAHATGARVFTTCAGDRREFVLGLGADRAIDYRSEDFVEVIRRETSGGVDVVFDTVGGDLLGRSVAACRPGGRLVGIVNTTGDFSMAFIKNLTLHFLFLQRGRDKLDALRGLVERGMLKPLVEAVLPLEDIADAHRALESGGRRGKLVLKVT